MEGRPDKPAVKCDGVVRSWRAFDGRINRIARRLSDMGLGRGDKIAILAANSIEYLETFMAACGPASVSCRSRPWRRPMRSRRCSTIATPRSCSCRTSTARWSSPMRDVWASWWPAAASPTILPGRVGRASRPGWRRRAMRRSRPRSARSTTSTSSTVPARPACPRASFIRTRCAASFPCASQPSTTGRTRSRWSRRRSIRTPRSSHSWPPLAWAARRS